MSFYCIFFSLGKLCLVSNISSKDNTCTQQHTGAGGRVRGSSVQTMLTSFHRRKQPMEHAKAMSFNSF